MAWRKAATFSGIDSAERLACLQQLCGSSTSSASVDALLIIGGVDSFHSTISQAVLKYLFLGSAGQELLGEQVISQQHECLEDVVLVIAAQECRIFYSSESHAAVQILPMISQWRHVHEFTFHDAMDPDEQETRKMLAFKDMVADFQRIGIPYGLDQGAGKDLNDTMIPEKWPLIQSYGLEDGNSSSSKGGFFTMHHDVVNVSSLLRDRIIELDTFSAKRVLLEVEPLLMHHYNQFLLKLDHAESTETRNTKSEVEMGEDLLSFYEFGTMQYESRGLHVGATRGARVLFGKRTSDLANKSSSTVHLKGASCGVFPATHMLVQVEDPFTGVRFVRTYFLSTGKVCHRIVDEDALVHPVAQQLEQHTDVETNLVDTRLMIELYTLLLRGFKAGVQTLVTMCRQQTKAPDTLESCAAAAKGKAIDVMTKYSMSRSHALQNYQVPAAFLENHLSVHAECMDSRGQTTDFHPQKTNLVYVSIRFVDIPSTVVPNESLGSLVVGDTVFFKPQGAGLQRSNEASAASFLSITKSFPYFRSWIQNGKEADFAQALVATLRSEFMLQSPAIQLGRAIATMDAMVDAAADSNSGQSDQGAQTAQVALSKALLLLDCDELPCLRGVMRLFSGGLVFLSPHVNPILISFAKHVSSFRVMPSQYEELVLLQIDLKEDDHTSSTPLSESLPFSFFSQSAYIPLLSGSRFQEEIIRVLSTWKHTAESLEIPFYRPHDLGVTFEGDTPRDSKASAGGNSAELPLVVQQTCVDLVKSQRSSAHENAQLIDAFFPRWFIPKDANPATTLGKPSADPRKVCVPITAMLGIPGSDVVNIAKSICAISSSTNDWVYIVVDARDANSGGKSGQQQYEQYAFEHIQLKLRKNLEVIKSDMNCLLHPRIMLSVVGFVDTITVATAIKRLALGAPPLQIKLSAVVACVSVTNVYLPDARATQSPFPRVFDQMTAGFTTHIVVTHSADVSASQLGPLRFRMDQVNPFADIHVLSQQVFEGSISSLLVLDRFESAYYTSFRGIHFPEWDTLSGNHNMSRYVAELASTGKLLPVSVRFEIAPGMERSSFLHLVGSTLTPFAAFTKSIKKLPTEASSSMSDKPEDLKGIRLAQSLATGKVRGYKQSLLSNNGVPRSDTSVSQSSAETAAKREHKFGDRCWGVEARVIFSCDPDCVYHYVSTGTSARLRIIDASSQQEPPSLEICITGCDLNIPKLHELLLHCYARVEGSVQPLRSKSTISIDEKREIQKIHALDPLPEGYLYDGTNYVDFFGGRYEFHPNIAQFIDEYVAASNECTKQANAKAEENRHALQTFVKQIV
uniref:Uncharacterized protein n=1 Tax=Globisporangium ultimum (strain ATCC 200006 / CBS 805.95 / DAOM BR144) TaxID=431595 RepID=K3W7E2_GLOUD